MWQHCFCERCSASTSSCHAPLTVNCLSSMPAPNWHGFYSPWVKADGQVCVITFPTTLTTDVSSVLCKYPCCSFHSQKWCFVLSHHGLIRFCFWVFHFRFIGTSHCVLFRVSVLFLTYWLLTYSFSLCAVIVKASVVVIHKKDTGVN